MIITKQLLISIRHNDVKIENLGFFITLIDYMK
jgi:hypothetical protein